MTDQKCLSQLTEQRLHTPWQQKVFSKLLGLSYKIVYRRGAENRAADALSRYPVSSYATISVAEPHWLSEVTKSYIEDEHAQSIITRLTTDEQSVPYFIFLNGLLRYKSRFWVGANTEIQWQLISELHSNAMGGAFWYSGYSPPTEAILRLDWYEQSSA